MKLTKTSQKLDNNICKALTIACESSLHVIEGFLWLTHRANYNNFPESLIVTCVFATNDDIKALEGNELAKNFRQNIEKQLLKIGIKIKNLNKVILFDSEEACELEHKGKWSERLAFRTASKKQLKSSKSLH